MRTTFLNISLCGKWIIFCINVTFAYPFNPLKYRSYITMESSKDADYMS